MRSTSSNRGRFSSTTRLQYEPTSPGALSVAMVHMLSPGVTTTEVGVRGVETVRVIGGGKDGSAGFAARAGTAGPAATARGTAARSTGSSMRRAVRTIAPLPTSDPSQTSARPQTWVASPVSATSRRKAAAASSGGTDASHTPKPDHSGRSQSGSKAASAKKQNRRAVTRMTIGATYAPGSVLGTLPAGRGSGAGTMPVEAKEHT